MKLVDQWQLIFCNSTLADFLFCPPNILVCHHPSFFVTTVKTVTKTKLFGQLLVTQDSRPLILFFVFILVISMVGLEWCCYNRGFSSFEQGPEVSTGSPRPDTTMIPTKHLNLTQLARTRPDGAPLPPPSNPFSIILASVLHFSKALPPNNSSLNSSFNYSNLNFALHDPSLD